MKKGLLICIAVLLIGCPVDSVDFPLLSTDQAGSGGTDMATGIELLAPGYGSLSGGSDGSGGYGASASGGSDSTSGGFGGKGTSEARGTGGEGGCLKGHCNGHYHGNHDGHDHQHGPKDD